MSEPTLHFLADRPQHVRTCAAWEYAAWGQGGGKTMADSLSCYDRTRSDTMPLTLIACRADDTVVAMVSLWESDCASRPDLTPWVASLYVAPVARQQGIGARLFRCIQAEAIRLGLDHLYLMTQHVASERFYRADGWQSFDRVDGPGALRQAVLMRKALRL
jgi:predicted N-acetyltransferase YhbS